MCGISGFWKPERDLPREALEARARAMAAAMRHRGPDDSGEWGDPEAGIALGFRRLSIIDLTVEGHQPMVSGCGRYVIVYNGEIYNFSALRAELEPLGHRFRGHSDTEVMLAAFTQWGFDAALERLNGMFALALWDRRERKLHLARDRLGEKPLYYGWSGSTFLWGSELKALRAYPGFQAEVNRDALTKFFRHNYVPAPHSIFRDVFKLPPGCKLTVDADPAATERPRPLPYWSAYDAAQRGLAERWPESRESEAVDALDALLRDAVGMRMVADVPLGAFLSGGIDSSTVVALMQAQSPRPVRTFSIGFWEEAFNEATHAKAVAAHLGTDHTELYVTPREALDVVPILPEFYDEPFADSSQIPTYLVAALARRHVTVSLSGDGGDELFGGYNRYAWGQRLWSKLGPLPAPIRAAAAKLLLSVPEERWDWFWRRAGGLLPRGWLPSNPGSKMHRLGEVLGAGSAGALYRSLVSHWNEPERIVVDGVERDGGFALEESGFGDFREWMMYTDSVTYLPDDILVKVDRAAMAVSLESRIPLLDPRVVEFAWRIPLGMKFRGGEGKWLLRQVLYRYVPRELIDRPKMGFGIPIGEWLRGPLRDWAEALLDESRLRREGFLRPEPILRKWREHVAGARNWQYLLWDVLMFQAWHEYHSAARPVPGQ